MTGTWFLIGTAIGLLTASLIIYRHGQHQIDQQPWPLEPDGIDIPAWVNQGNRAVIGQYEEILAMIHEAAHIELWEAEMRLKDWS